MKTLQHKFVEQIPDVISPGILYVSMDYATAIHSCACGCGNEVVTPLSPSDWKLLYDGETVTLKPSIGNWNFRCRSHYWITNNKIVDASSWDINVPLKDKKKSKKKRKWRWFSKE